MEKLALNKRFEIFDLVFQYLHLDLLKACRLVHPEWYGTSLHDWRKRAILRIHNSDCAKVGALTSLSLEEWTRLADANEEDLLSLSNPFRNYRLVCWKKWGRDENRFFEEWGPSMRHLYLEECTLDVSYLMDILYRLAPNLEKLVLDGVEVGKDSENIYGIQWNSLRSSLRCLEINVDSEDIYPFARTFSWKEFLRTVPHLGELTLPKVTPGEFMDVLSTIKEMRGMDYRNFPLTHLNFEKFREYKLTHAMVQLLQDSSLPLKKLWLPIEKDTDPLVIQNILGLYSTSLESLGIWPGYNSSPQLFQLTTTTFNSLTELHFQDGIVSDLLFLKRMPTLEKLILNCKCPYSDYLGLINKTCNIDPSMVRMKFPSLKEFQFINRTQGQYGISFESVIQIIRWMPNLRKLTMPLRRECFQLICLQCPELEELTAWKKSGEVMDDEILTGYSRKPNEDGDYEKRAPGLSDLTNLKTFALVSDEGFRKITDHSVFHGFLKLPHLQKLFLPATTVSMLDAVRIHLMPRLEQAVAFSKEEQKVSYECQYFHKFLHPEDDKVKLHVRKHHCSMCVLENCTCSE